MRPGKFIVLEGIDGAGTSTHVKLLGEWLENEGHSVVITEEPTAELIGTLIRDNLHAKKTSPIVDALLFAADRLDHWEKLIKPSLATDKIVISDRFIESSLAYQTAAGLEMAWVLEINKFVEEPDLTIILDVDPEIGLSRKPKLGDKFENVTFLGWVRDIYLKRATEKDYPIVRTDSSIEKVQTQLQKIVLKIL